MTPTPEFTPNVRTIAGLPVQPDHEQKFLFEGPWAPVLLEWLDHACVPDRTYPLEVISSVYFDHPTLDLYYEKRNSDYLKSKVRLRWYGSPAEVARLSAVEGYLEVKSKYGANRSKQRLPVSIPSATLTGDPLADPMIAELPRRVPELGYTAQGALVPMLVVQYTRHRFHDPFSGSGVALDTAIRCTHLNDRHLAGHAPVDLDMGVLEVKGLERGLPPSLRPISSFLVRTTFSKYAFCCERLTQPLGRRI